MVWGCDLGILVWLLSGLWEQGVNEEDLDGCNSCFSELFDTGKGMILGVVGGLSDILDGVYFTDCCVEGVVYCTWDIDDCVKGIDDWGNTGLGCCEDKWIDCIELIISEDDDECTLSGYLEVFLIFDLVRGGPWGNALLCCVDCCSAFAPVNCRFKLRFSNSYIQVIRSIVCRNW